MNRKEFSNYIVKLGFYNQSGSNFYKNTGTKTIRLYAYEFVLNIDDAYIGSFFFSNYKSVFDEHLKKEVRMYKLKNILK